MTLKELQEMNEGDEGDERDSNITTWLKNNTKLSWKATGGDDPNKRGWDANSLNKSEGYEVKDLIAQVFNDCNINCTDENIKIAYDAIMSSTTRDAYITHLKTLFHCTKSRLLTFDNSQ